MSTQFKHVKFNHRFHKSTVGYHQWYTAKYQDIENIFGRYDCWDYHDNIYVGGLPSFSLLFKADSHYL